MPSAKSDICLERNMLLFLKQSKRFKHIYISEDLYIFDGKTLNIIKVKPRLRQLIENADKPEKFSLLLEKLDLEEIKSIFLLIRGIQNVQLYSNDTSITGWINSIHLNISNRCNLSCRYCFKDTAPQETNDWSILYKAVDYLVYECGKYTNEYSIGFGYSGEPLFYCDKIKDLLNYIKEIRNTTGKNIKLHFTTNGTLLSEEILKSLYTEGVLESFSISIDGPSEAHDVNRAFTGGKPTLGIIRQNLKAACSTQFKIYAKSVITKNYPCPAKILESHIDMGFEDIYMKPVRAGHEDSFDDTNVEKLKEGYDEYFSIFLEDVLNDRFYRLEKYLNDYALRYLQTILFFLKDLSLKDVNGGNAIFQ